MKLRLTHAMHQAIESVAGGMPVVEAAELYGVTANGLYRALRRDATKCPTCGRTQKRDAEGLMRDAAAMAPSK